MENWCWEPEALAFISVTLRPVKTAAEGTVDKMLAAKTTAALFILRQLEFGLFDFVCTRSLTRSKGLKSLETLAEIKTGRRVRRGSNVGPLPACRLQPHFAGGYAAGYQLSVADVLAADAFSLRR